MLIEKKGDYYSAKAISNSLLGILETSPKLFKNYLDNGYTSSSSKYMELGTMVHSCLLEPEKFNNEYLPLTVEKPKSANATMFCRKIVEGDDLYNAYMKSYSIGKLKEDAVIKLAKECYAENLEYIKFYKKSEGKTLISKEEYEIINNINFSASEHKLASKLLNAEAELSSDSINYNRKVFTEYEIFFEFDSRECKSKLDKVIIDYENKQVVLIDVKTTSKSVHKFKKQLEVYNIDRQMAFYGIALHAEFPELGTFDFICYIIAVQTTGTNECAVYELSENILAQGYGKVEECFEIINIQENFGFDYPYEYYKGDGSISLDIDFEEEEEYND